jgi:DNA adenine methylase
MSKQTSNPKKHDPAFSLDMPFSEALERFSNVNTKDLSDIPEDEEQGDKATPFLKWVGGKRSIMHELTSRLPEHFNTYWEGFVGGGALFFELQSKLNNAVLNDANMDLILTYKVIQKDVEKLIEILEKHQAKHNEVYYYHIRSQHNLEDPIEIAARMIYLNKTCFNGLYRVNSKGEFNVPMGKYVNPGICQKDNLLLCNKALQNVDVRYGDYSKLSPQNGDFIYFDPPYHPTTDTSFTKYAVDGFTEQNQRELSEFCKSLHKKGVKIMVSNSNTPFIRDLYKGNMFKISIVNAPRLVNCKPNGRNAVEEVLITNY